MLSLHLQNYLVGFGVVTTCSIGTLLILILAQEGSETKILFTHIGRKNMLSLHLQNYLVGFSVVTTCSIGTLLILILAQEGSETKNLFTHIEEEKYD